LAGDDKTLHSIGEVWLLGLEGQRVRAYNGGLGADTPVRPAMDRAPGGGQGVCKPPPEAESLLETGTKSMLEFFNAKQLIGLVTKRHTHGADIDTCMYRFLTNLVH